MDHRNSVGGVSVRTHGACIYTQNIHKSVISQKVNQKLKIELDLVVPE